MGTFTFRLRLPDGSLSVSTITVLDLEHIVTKFKEMGADVLKIIEKPFDNEEFIRKFIW